MNNLQIIHFFTIEKGWTLESVGYYLILYMHDKLIVPDQIKRLYSKGMSLYEQFKSEEW
jgi:hypothetical protein